MVQASVPDGGWGWVVVACSFFFHVAGGAGLYSLSVFYSSWVEYFDTGRGLTAWVLTLSMAMSVCAGPIAASLGSRFGYRPVVITGGLFLGVGLFFSYFATSIYVLMVTIGILAGLGKGLGYLPALAILPTYFEKKRALAIGIGTSGTGVGAFFLPPLLAHLEEVYSWRGTMFIMSGFMLNVCVCGALMRPAEPVYKEEVEDSKYEDVIVEENDNDVLSVFSSEHDDMPPDGKIPLLTHRPSGPESAIGEDVKTVKEDVQVVEETNTNNVQAGEGKEDNAAPDPEGSSNCLPSNGLEKDDQTNQVHLNGHVTLSDLDLNGDLSKKPTVYRLRGTGSTSSGTRVPLPNKHVSKVRNGVKRGFGGSFQHLRSSGSLDKTKSKPFFSVTELRRPSSFFSVSSPAQEPTKGSIRDLKPITLSRMDVMMSGNILNALLMEKEFSSKANLKTDLSSKSNLKIDHIPTHISHDSLFKHAVISEIEVKPMEEVEEEYAEEYEHYEKPQSRCAKFMTYLHVYRDLLRSPSFLVMVASNLLTNLSYLMPIVYIVDRAVYNGIDKSSASLALSCYGIGNLIGRVFMGLLADRSFVDSFIAYIGCLLVCGVATCMSPLCGPVMALHALYGFIFGMFIGGYVTLTPVVLVDLLGVAVVGQSYGLLLLFQGIGVLLGTPLAGWMFDLTNNYTIAFTLHGFFIIIAAVILIPLKIVIKRKEKKAASV